jgi:8-oxo-dGTP diphosphatase
MNHDLPESVPAPVCTVDVVLLTLLDERLQVALLPRDRAPHGGTLALPGGFIHPQTDRDTQDAAERVLRDKAGLRSPHLEQLATFSGPDRDPRGWSVSVVYVALVPAMLLAQGHAHVRWQPVDALPPLPFDHTAIVAQAVARVRSKSLYTSLPAHFCGEHFTLPQLQAVCEAVLGERLNKVSFRRRMEALGLLVPVVGERTGGAHRPAQVWRLA